MPNTKKSKKNQKGGFPFGKRKKGNTNKVKGEKANEPNEESPYINLHPVRRSLNYNNIATYGILPPIINKVTSASNELKHPNVNPKRTKKNLKNIFGKFVKFGKLKKSKINERQNLENIYNVDPDKYNPEMFENGYKPNRYYNSGFEPYNEAEPVPHTYMEMQNPALENMPNPITSTNIVTGTVKTVANHTELATPVKQTVLTGPERPKNQIPENPERLVKPSEVKRTNNQSSLFKRHRRPLSMIQKQAAPAAGGSRKYRTKKVRKTRK